MMLLVAGYVRMYAGMLGFAFSGVTPFILPHVFLYIFKSCLQEVLETYVYRTSDHGEVSLMSQTCQLSLWSLTLVGYVVMWEVCGKSELYSTATTHYTCDMQHAPNTGTPTYAQKSRGGHPRCDLAPLTTSFGTVGQWGAPAPDNGGRDKP